MSSGLQVNVTVEAGGESVEFDLGVEKVPAYIKRRWGTGDTLVRVDAGTTIRIVGTPPTAAADLAGEFLETLARKLGDPIQTTLEAPSLGGVSVTSHRSQLLFDGERDFGGVDYRIIVEAPPAPRLDVPVGDPIFDAHAETLNDMWDGEGEWVIAHCDDGTWRVWVTPTGTATAEMIGGGVDAPGAASVAITNSATFLGSILARRQYDANRPAVTIDAA